MSNQESLSLLERQVAIPSRRRFWLFLFCCVSASMMGAAFVVTQSLKQVNVNVRVGQLAQWVPNANPPSIVASDLCEGQRCPCPSTTMNAVVTQSEVRRFLDQNISEKHIPRIVPSLANGVQVGFKLYGIDSKSLWARVGLVSGDTIHKVQGIDLHSPHKVMDFYYKLKSETQPEIHVDLSRRGCAATLDLSIVRD